jgi:hypothetical protein
MQATLEDFGKVLEGARKNSAPTRRTTDKQPTTTRRPRRSMCFICASEDKGVTWFVCRGGDKLHRPLWTFQTLKEASAFIRDTPQAVKEARWEEVRLETIVTEECLRKPENLPRVGSDYRQGRDVTAEQFMDTFAPAGGQFGNWVTAEERVSFLNQTFDAFMDLSGFLGIPPKGLFFDGTLGIAFGSRGHGKFAAHYEHGVKIINLTRPRGAGCLGHEWAHALDNVTSGGDSLMQRSPQVIDCFKRIPKALKTRSGMADRTRSGSYYARPVEIFARAFEGWVRSHVENDFLANIVKQQDYTRGHDRYPYPVEVELAEVDTAFRTLFNSL